MEGKRWMWLPAAVIGLLWIQGVFAPKQAKSSPAGQSAPGNVPYEMGAAREIDRDGHCIAYDNGTVRDTTTGLMWAARDNGRDITWEAAEQYCRNYRGGGYTDWRLPTLDELEGLFDQNRAGYRPTCARVDWQVYLTRLIRLSCGCHWASDRHGTDASFFYFYTGFRPFAPPSLSIGLRALPVRSGQ